MKNISKVGSLVLLVGGMLFTSLIVTAQMKEGPKPGLGGQSIPEILARINSKTIQHTDTGGPDGIQTLAFGRGEGKLNIFFTNRTSTEAPKLYDDYLAGLKGGKGDRGGELLRMDREIIPDGVRLEMWVEPVDQATWRLLATETIAAIARLSYVTENADNYDSWKKSTEFILRQTNETLNNLIPDGNINAVAMRSSHGDLALFITNAGGDVWDRFDAVWHAGEGQFMTKRPQPKMPSPQAMFRNPKGEKIVSLDIGAVMVNGIDPPTVLHVLYETILAGGELEGIITK